VIVENNNSHKDSKSLRKTPRAILLLFLCESWWFRALVAKLFYPLNTNHIKLSQYCLFQKNLNRVYVIVENNNSHKDSKSLRKTPRTILLLFLCEFWWFRD